MPVFVTVVTVGSELLSPGEEPDAIRIIDTASFSITSTLVPSTLDLQSHCRTTS